jgi:hypothetical protein
MWPFESATQEGLSGLGGRNEGYWTLTVIFSDMIGVGL